MTTAGFIVLEGLDGSGTTTQSKLLHEHLTAAACPSVLTFEPTDEPIGKLIRDTLSGRVVSPRRNEPVTFSEVALSYLFAADRVEHSNEIRKWLDASRHVVCDRYVWSSIAYQSSDRAIDPSRVAEINSAIAVPDVTILLEVTVDACLERLAERKDSPTVYERRELLEAIDKNYRATRSLYERHFGPVVVVDGGAPPEHVHQRILDVIAEYVQMPSGAD